MSDRYGPISCLFNFMRLFLQKSKYHNFLLVLFLLFCYCHATQNSPVNRSGSEINKIQNAYQVNNKLNRIYKFIISDNVSPRREKILSKRTMRNLDHELRLVMATLTTAISHTGDPSSGCEMIVLCTYQRPSRGVNPGEPRGICTKTFANSTYPFVHAE